MRTRSCTSTRTASWAKAMTLAAVAILILDLASPVAWAQSPDWVVETVTDGGQCSLAYAPDNNPSIAYVQNGTVMFAHWNGASWDTETVAVGGMPDLAYDPLTGEAMICYTYNGVRYARRTGSSWTAQNVDTVVVGNFPQLACDPKTGRPAIAYESVVNRVYALKFARWSGSSWDIGVVETGTKFLGFGNPSLAYDSAGNPAIAFRKDSTGLKLARWNPATASWGTEVVDSASLIDTNVSLAFNPVSGHPAVTYCFDNGAAPRIAQWNGATWDIQVYHPNGIVNTPTEQWAGFDCSLAFDQSGAPHISHTNWYPGPDVGGYGDDRQELTVTRWTGSAWMHEILATDPSSGQGGAFQWRTDIAFHPVSKVPTVATCRLENAVTRVILARRTSLVYQWPPVVSILVPADGARFNTGATVDFLGSANDVENGDLSAALVWTSHRDSQIGTGASFFTNTLSRGVHTITASATDSGGKTGSASIKITVGTPAVVSVSSITYALSGRYLNDTIALVDDFGAPVAGASVSASLYRDGTKVTSWTGTTGADGKVTFQYKSPTSGTYTTTVTNVTATGLAWDGVTPPNSFKK